MQYSSRIHIRATSKEAWKKLYKIDTKKYYFNVSAEQLFSSGEDFVIDDDWWCPPNELEAFVKDVAGKIKDDGIVVADNYSSSSDPYTYVYMCVGDRMRTYHFEWPDSRDDPYGEMWDLYKNGVIRDLGSYLSYKHFFTFNEKENNTLLRCGIELLPEEEVEEVPQDDVLDFEENGSVLIGFLPGKSASTIVIPNTVRKIGPRAFVEDITLRSVVCPDSLEIFSTQSFWACPHLEKIVFPRIIKEMGDRAFGFCNLKSVVIPESLKEIPDGAFCGNYNLSKVQLHDEIYRIGSSSFSSCAFTSIKMPAALKEIGNKAFLGCKLEKVDLPNQLETIGHEAFAGSIHITSVLLPKSLKIVGINAFHNCRKLEEITIPSGVQEIGDSAFFECRQLEIINISDSVIKIGKDAFRDTAVKKISIPGSIRELPGGLLQECKNLEEVIVEDGITKIGTRAFAKCPNLKSVYIRGTLQNKQGAKVFDKSPNVTVYGIPGTLAETLAFENGVRFEPINDF